MSTSIPSPLSVTFSEMLQSSQCVAEIVSRCRVVEGVLTAEDVFEELMLPERGLEGSAQNEWRLDC